VTIARALPLGPFWQPTREVKTAGACLVDGVRWGPHPMPRGRRQTPRGLALHPL